MLAAAAAAAGVSPATTSGKRLWRKRSLRKAGEEPPMYNSIPERCYQVSETKDLYGYRTKHEPAKGEESHDKNKENKESPLNEAHMKEECERGWSKPVQTEAPGSTEEYPVTEESV